MIIEHVESNLQFEVILKYDHISLIYIYIKRSFLYGFAHCWKFQTLTYSCKHRCTSVFWTNTCKYFPYWQSYSTLISLSSFIHCIYLFWPLICVHIKLLNLFYTLHIVWNMQGAWYDHSYQWLSTSQLYLNNMNNHIPYKFKAVGVPVRFFLLLLVNSKEALYRYIIVDNLENTTIKL